MSIQENSSLQIYFLIKQKALSKIKQSLLLNHHKKDYLNFL